MKIKITLFFAIILSGFNMLGVNYFWVGGSGSWSDFASHWATVSGGSAFYTQVPQSTDNVFFDSQSFTSAGQTLTIDQPFVQCADMTWTGVTNTPAFYGNSANKLKIYGSLTLSSDMVFNFIGPISFEATTAGQTITTASKILNTSLTFNGIGGGWTLADQLTTNWMYLNNGALNTNNQTVNAFAFTSSVSSTRALYMGSSTFNLSFYGTMWNINPTGMTLNASASTIKGTAVSGGAQNFYGGGFTYNNIFFTGTQSGKINGSSIINNVSFAADGYIQGICTFNDVFFAANAYLTSNSTYNNVTISKNGNFASSNTFNNLILSPGFSYTLKSGSTQTINNAMTANGSCGSLIDIKSTLAGSQTYIKKTIGNITLSNVNLKDINGTGGAVFTAANSNDLGNNSGWTINSFTSKNLFWIGNGGNWNDGNHWSAVSGGPPAGCSPTPADNVFFDANSFSAGGQTVTINVPTAFVNNMVWTGVTNNPELYGDYTNALKIYGSLNLDPGMTFNYTGSIVFEANTSGQTITSAGKTLNTSLTFNGVGGSWILQDELKCSYWIYLNNGTLNTNNQKVSAYALSSITSSARVLNMGTSIFNLNFNGAVWDINNTGITINAGSSTINGIGITGGQQDFYGGGFIYHNISFIGAALAKIIDGNTLNDVAFGADGFIQGGTFHDVSFAANATIYNNNICNSITFSKNANILGSNNFNNLVLTPGYTYTLAAGATQTINTSMTASGNCGALIDLKSSTPGTQTNINKATGAVTLSFVSLKDINAAGGASFTADNSNDLGNNTGWTSSITPTLSSKNLFWVGNGGNWNDGNHWSNISGGPAAGCSPTTLDNVFFDANSFSQTGQIVTINIPAALVNNMIWTGVTNNPSLYGNYSNKLAIYGSLTLSAGMNLDFTGPLVFESTAAGKTITTAGKVINTSLTFNGIGGSWTLQDEMKCSYWIYLNNGTLSTNNQTVNAYAFSSITSSARTLNMGSSAFNLSFNGAVWNVNHTGMTVNAGTSSINGIGTSGGQQEFNGGGFAYNNIFFIGAGLGKIIDNNTINDVSFGGDGVIQGGTFPDVSFAANAVMYYNNICNNVSIAKNADILGSNTFNFLKLSPGYTYTLKSGETQTILAGGDICAQGTGALPIRIQSSINGAAANISKTSGTICWDYVRLSDINASGGATFNAGLAPVSSQNMGGNTGILFTGGCYISGCTPCIPPSFTANPINSSICAGANTVFAAAAFGSGITYQWQVSQGAGFANISNINPYSGTTSNTLSITAAANGLNGNTYRCLVSGACGSVVISNPATLTVNTLPTAISSVNSLTITVSAVGGTSPYTGTGNFNVLTAGNYSYTIMDSKGCSASTSALVTIPLADIIPPTAICKNASVTLLNGTAQITANDINNGSYDNVSISSITVTPNTFTCANIGANIITLTVKDSSGNVSTCQSTLTVIGSLPPSITFQPINSSICAGANTVFAAAAIGSGLTYQWQVSQGASFVNLSNIAPYSGTASNTLNITAAANGLNGNKYRCLVSGVCGTVVISNLGILTVNALPTAFSSVNSLTITVSAAGGTSPYTGTGNFNVLTAGTYSYIIMDSKGCSASTAALVTLPEADIIPPTAICKNASVTLSNGTAQITTNDINNGSYDNVSIASITVTPNTFTCANIGANLITLKVIDNSGNVSSCQSTLIVVGSVPTVSISEGVLPDFWQGSTVVLNANTSQVVSYLWNTGETNPSKNVYYAGTNSVTVTNNNGCTASASYTNAYVSENLLSSYAIIASEEAEFKNFTYVQSGGVGVTNMNGEIEVENNSKITGISTFAKAADIDINPTSVVTNKLYSPLSVILPSYKTNPYCEGNSEKPKGHNNDNSESCSQSIRNKTVANNAAANLDDSIYSVISVGNNATAIFTQPVVYIKSLTTGSNSKIEFSGCTEIRVCGDIELGDYTIFNSSGKGVVIYCDEKAHLNKGSIFTGSIYSKGEIETKGTCTSRILMKGMFIGKEVESEYTNWNWNDGNNSCFSARSAVISANGNADAQNNDNLSVTVYPNPSENNFNLLITSYNDAPSTIKVSDITGRLVFTNDNTAANSSITFGHELKEGIYLLTITQGNVTKTLRIVKTR